MTTHPLYLLLSRHTVWGLYLCLFRLMASIGLQLPFIMEVLGLFIIHNINLSDAFFAEIPILQKVAPKYAPVQGNTAISLFMDNLENVISAYCLFGSTLVVGGFSAQFSDIFVCYSPFSTTPYSPSVPLKFIFDGILSSSLCFDLLTILFLYAGHELQPVTPIVYFNPSDYNVASVSPGFLNFYQLGAGIYTRSQE